MTFLLGWLRFHHRHQTKDLRAFRVLYVTKNDSNRASLGASHLREFFPTLIKVTERLRNRWSRAADNEASVNVQQDLMRYTVDVTSNLAFGYDMNTLESMVTLGKNAKCVFLGMLATSELRVLLS